MSSFIYLDTETTGLNQFGTDEILEISIVGDDGEVLLDTFLKPKRHTAWPEAQNIHHISPEMVANAPSYDDIRDELIRIFSGKDIVAYNVRYDKGFFDNELVDMANSWNCAMLAFGDCIGEKRWQKLEKAIAHIGYNFEGEAHRSLTDTRAARAVWRYVNSEAF